MLGWVFTARHAWRPLLLAGGTLVAIVGVRLIAELVGRARPPVRGMLIGPELSESFPSGHVVGAAAIMLLTAYLVFSRRRNPRAAVAAFVVASLGIVATAASRVYLGYHWATDAVGAACVALIVLGLVIAIDTYRTSRVADAGSPALGAAPISGGTSTAENG
ncbi:MAG: phosphatase PAP2 family protein [Microbacteriaceae bacterium]|nr:phosphatase PAP2 family protein [Microbacteriaceae bacterium]